MATYIVSRNSIRRVKVGDPMPDYRLRWYNAEQLAWLRERFADAGLDPASVRGEEDTSGSTILDRAAMRGERSEVEDVLRATDWARVGL